MAGATSPSLESCVPPVSSTVFQSSSQVLTFDHFKRLWVDLVKAGQEAEPTDAGATKPESTDNVQVAQTLARASKLDFKVVDEMYVLRAVSLTMLMSP